MTTQDRLTAEAVVPLEDAQAVHARLCEHLKEHAEVTVDGNVARIDSYYGDADLSVSAGTLHVRVSGVDDTRLSVMKSVFAEHLHELATGTVPAFAWSGADAARRDIPYLRELVAVGTRQLTPRMRRVILKGDAAHYDTGDYHVRVLIAPEGRDPVWPHAAPDGRTIWPTGPDALTPRVYTVRSVDLAANEIAIDVVLHDGSAGTRWAQSIALGDRVGLLGPGGSGRPPEADAYVFAGDETALPVIARMAETLPASARLITRIEIADQDEEQPIATAADLDLGWLHRGATAAGDSDLLERAVRDLDWNALPERIFVFVAAEQAATRRIRSFLDKERGLHKSSRLAAAYWRKDASTTTD
ncbi:siderophore-interacting protein [Amorphus orientalis]|uniref:NADPH-dependent ferric siderophore reductase n=1 Tax=Amorphus orientalis TaxID=649198 RepID=A0AAE4ARP9_9HYPH|nr:siderophore-interacting protein [Amorphus orientalis]MDQ0315356.1 NADPH-dependent ferric siderophore reductase [Amorphus orientalis]